MAPLSRTERTGLLRAQQEVAASLVAWSAEWLGPCPNAHQDQLRRDARQQCAWAPGLLRGLPEWPVCHLAAGV